jgi:hypothetical protein
VKRYHDEIPLMKRREKLWTVVVGKTGKTRGYFRKKKPFDCGKSRCSVCSVDPKFPKRTPTRKELLHECEAD